jgi:hypothetical protein
VRDQPAFYPVLHSFEDGDEFSRTVAHIGIARGLGVFASRKRTQPESGAAVDYVKKSELPRYGLTEAKLIDLCYANFFKGKIRVEAQRERGEIVLQVSSSDGPVSAIIGHASAYERLARFLHTPGNITIFIGGPDELRATTIGSHYEGLLKVRAARNLKQAGRPDVIPAVYHWTKSEGLVPVSDR